MEALTIHLLYMYICAAGAAGAAFPNGLYVCPFWPVRAVERYPGPFNSTHLANRILVIGNTVRLPTSLSYPIALS